MIAPKWVEKNLDTEQERIRYWFYLDFTPTRAKIKHHKKLNEIQGKEPKNIAKMVEDELERQRQDKLRTKEFLQQGNIFQ